MKTLTKTLSAVAVLVLTACGGPKSQTSQLASNYPPDYSWNSTCAYNEILEVCRSENGVSSFMKIYYKGNLMNSTNLRAFVKLNGREGFFGSFTAAMDGRRPLTLSNASYNCRPQYDEHGVVSYNCEKPTDEMKGLFFFAKDQIGRFNAWDVEIAIVDQDNKWDSNLGANYKFRIE